MAIRRRPAQIEPTPSAVRTARQILGPDPGPEETEDLAKFIDIETGLMPLLVQISIVLNELYEDPDGHRAMKRLDSVDDLKAIIREVTR